MIIAQTASCGNMQEQSLKRSRVARIFLVFFALLLIVAQTPTHAQQLVEQIIITGNKRVSAQTIRSYLSVNPGDFLLDPLAADQALKNLFATDLFADVSITQEGSTLIVNVQENPAIRQIAFEGNKKLNDKLLEPEISLAPRQSFVRGRVAQDRQRLLDLYRQRGYFSAQIEPQIIPQGEDQVDLVFEINEGPVAGVRAISFIGNRNFSDRTLRGKISTKQSAWWRLLSSADIYDADRIQLDQRLLERFYKENGYSDARVITAIAEFDPSASGFVVNYTIEEGPRYRIGAIEFINDLPGNPELSGLKDVIKARHNSWINESIIARDVRELTRRVNSQGQPFAIVSSRLDKKPDEGLLNVVFAIREGAKAYVERIDIEGNKNTNDRVIRREFELAEGDPVNPIFLRSSKRNIERLGYFKTVEPAIVSGSAKDRKIVKIKVEEIPTGEVSLGAGYSTALGPVGNFELRERNLFGEGYRASLSATLAGRRSGIDIGLTDPYFLGKDFSAGVSAFHSRSNRGSDSSYQEQRTGGGVHIGYEIFDDARQTWRYNFTSRDVRNIGANASLIVQADEGRRSVSRVTHEITYDSRDSIITPREGSQLSLTTSVAGLGGNVRNLRNRARGTLWFPVAQDSAISTSLEAGSVFGFGQDTRVSDRFTVGYYNLRGFRYAGVGPRDATTNDYLGAKNYVTGSTQFEFTPPGFSSDLGLRSFVFLDAGSAWGYDNPTGQVVAVNDDLSLRASTGLGFSWSSPVGPVSMSFAVPILKEDYDIDQSLSISLGYRF